MMRKSANPELFALKAGSAIIFAGHGERIHAGYAYPAAVAHIQNFSRIIIAAERLTSDCIRLKLWCERRFGDGSVTLFIDRSCQQSTFDCPNLDLDLGLLAKIYGTEYLQSSANIIATMRKIRFFEVVRQRFPKSVFVLGENEKAHFEVYCRVLKKPRRMAVFVPLVPALRGEGRMSSRSEKTAIMLRTSPEEANQKILRATTSPLGRSDGARFQSCQLRRSLNHVIAEANKRRIISHCQNGGGCEQCKDLWSKAIAEDFLVSFDQLSPVRDYSVPLKKPEVFRYKLP